MTDSIIEVENLSKSYSIKHQQTEHYTTLCDTLVNGAKDLGHYLLGRSSDVVAPTEEEIWALNDVSFEVKQGERVGIIGRNGAGKSTLLKILSRITEPTKGRARIKGRVASLLEVGTGFHHELTGRENIYLNGAILGMRRTEIQRKFDEIVAFAEIEKFLDTPVKRYSSGMYIRLAFAVAAHLEPEILVVDEVLAVGDIAFQKKCLGKMESITSDGRTVLFVSHNMAAIRTLCTNALTLEKGKIVKSDSVDKCIDLYQMQIFQGISNYWENCSSKKRNGLVISRVSCELSGKQPNLEIRFDIDIESQSNHSPGFLSIDILDSSGTPIMQAVPESDTWIKYKLRNHSIKVLIQLPPLIPGQYLATIWIGNHYAETFHEIKEAVMFEITTSPISSRSFPHNKNHGHISPRSTVEYVN